MKSSEMVGNGEYKADQAWPCVKDCEPRISALHLVTIHEMENLRAALARGHVPADFQRKLDRLESQSLRHHYIRQNSLLFLSLLQAVHAGAYPGGSPAQRELLLRVLAYVRKEDDAIADRQPDGFVDDHQEIREICRDLEPLLRHYKLWRLRHQVPALWQNSSYAGGPRNAPASSACLT
jgi:hypothetical protein